MLDIIIILIVAVILALTLTTIFLTLNSRKLQKDEWRCVHHNREYDDCPELNGETWNDFPSDRKYQ